MSFIVFTVFSYNCYHVFCYYQVNSISYTLFYIMSPISTRIFSFGVVLILHTEVKLLLLFLQLMWLTAGDFDHILLDTVSLQYTRTFVQMNTVFEWARVQHFGFRELRPDNTGKKEKSRTRSQEIKHLLLNNKMLLLLLKELARLLALQVRIRLHDIISLVSIYVLCFQEFQLKKSNKSSSY